MSGSATQDSTQESSTIGAAGRHLATDRGLTPLVSIALAMLLVPTCLRVLLPNDPFPIWDVNPFKFPTPTVGVTPSLSIVLDLITIFGAALALLITGSVIRLWEIALYAIGALVVTLHALVVDGGSLDNLRIGSGWTSALAAALGVRALASDPIVRRWLFAILLGCSMPLAIHSLVQVYIEHPSTVASYRANPNAFLEAQGWTPGSASARNYERRLMQPEATGWFGMANVHATFAAACVIGWAGVILARFGRKASQSMSREGEFQQIRGEPILIGLMVALAVVMLFLTRSKGGYAAAGLGLGVLALAIFVPSRRGGLNGRASGGMASGGEPSRSVAENFKTHAISFLPRMIGPLVLIGVIMAIVVRGVVGTRIGELSLLFRWFYISAAMRMFADSPLLGVGPADFRPAYELAKNPLSPEEVTSPHSLPFDWLSTLGLGGLAWIALLVVFAIAIGRGLTPIVTLDRDHVTPETRKPTIADRGPLHFTMPLLIACALILLPCVVAFIIELSGYAQVLMMGTTITDMAIVLGQSRVPGAILWLLATALLLTRPIADHVLRPVLACIGLALLASACIDLAPVWANSAPLFFVWLGLSASADVARMDGARKKRYRRAAIGVIILLTTALPMALALPKVMTWERTLVKSGSRARSIGMLSMRLHAIERDSPHSGDSLERWLDDVSSYTLPPGDWQPRDVLSYIWIQFGGDGAVLEQGPRGVPFHPKSLLAASEVAIDKLPALQRLRAIGWPKSGEAHDPINAEPWQLADRAEALASIAAQQFPRTSSSHAAVGRANLAKALVLPSDSQDRAPVLATAVSAFESAAALDPHGITYPLQLYQLATSMGDRDLQRRWGEELLRRNANMNLDPLRALTPEEVARVEASLRPSP